jgi:hypothetical protein
MAGHGGISSELTSQAVEQLPVMVTPKWVSTRAQPSLSATPWGWSASAPLSGAGETPCLAQPPKPTGYLDVHRLRLEHGW